MRFPVFLIGLMGAGKSTVGKELAHSFQCTYMDTDNQLEQLTGMRTTELFKINGETYFRELEKELALTFEEGERLVVATGGGFPCNSGVMDYLKSIGTIIYLKATPSQLASRLEQESDMRPLLSNTSSREEIVKFLINQLGERESYYNQAHFSIEVNKSVEEVVCQIQLILEQS
jgi:shikimate kinase